MGDWGVGERVRRGFWVSRKGKEMVVIGFNENFTDEENMEEEHDGEVNRVDAIASIFSG